MGRAVRAALAAGSNVRPIAAGVGGLVVAASLTGLPMLRGGEASATGLVPVAGPMHGDPSELADGYTHLVVAFADGVTSTAPRGGPSSEQAAPQAATEPAPAAPGERRAVPVTEVDGVADTGELVALASQGRLVRLTRDPATDQLVAVVEVPAGSTLGSAPPAAVARPAGAPVAEDGRDDEPGVELVGVAPDDPHVQVLASVPGTREIEGVGGGWYAVATEGDQAGYEALEGVRSVVEDVALSVSVDPSYGDQWHLRNTGTTVAGITGMAGADVGAEDAWAVADGSGIVVAVVDSGIEITHPDLSANIWSNDDDCGDLVDDDGNGYVDDCHGWDLLNGDNKVDDVGSSRWGGTIDNTHATHVAGIVAAERDNGIGVTGLAPRARIMPVKISDASSMSMSTAATAIRYAVDNGADVVNCSFGTNAGTTLAQVAPMQDAVRYAQQHGVMVVAAAGNDGRDIDAVPTYPAALPEANLIAVGASTNADTRASFSNWGAGSVDLFAPGWSVVSTLPGARYGSLHGTSMATPVVAAAAALVMEAKPALGFDQVKDLLLTASAPIAEFAGISVSGERLDVGQVLNPSGAQRQEPVSFTFNGFDAAMADQPATASIDAAVAASAVPTGARVEYRATLLTNVDGIAYGVSGAEIVTGNGVAVTDADASVRLAPAGGYPADAASGTLAAGFTLPAGDYALVAEASSTLDGSTIGPRWAVFFTVAAPGQTAPPTTVAPVPGPTTAPGGSTPTPGPSTGGTAPGSPPSGGGQPGGSALPPSGSAQPVPGSAPAGSSPGEWQWGWWSLPTDWSWTWPAPSSDGSWTWPAPSPQQPVWPAPSPSTSPSSPAPQPTAPAQQPASPTPPAPSPTRPASPGTGGTTPAVTLPPPPAPVSNGTLTVRSVDPRYGTTDGGTRVRIDGDGFTGTMRVLFGATPGSSVTVLSRTALLVTTPAHVTPGTVDVRVATAAGSVVLPGAFTYLAPSSGAPTPGTGGTSPAPGTGPSSPPPTTPPGSSPPAANPPSTTTPTTEAPAASLGFTFGDVTRSRGSLQLRPLIGRSPLDGHPASTWGTRRCRTSPCAGTKL